MNDTFKLICKHRIELVFNYRTVGASFPAPRPLETGTPLYKVEPIIRGDVEDAAKRVVDAVVKYLKEKQSA